MCMHQKGWLWIADLMYTLVFKKYTPYYKCEIVQRLNSLIC